MRHLVSLALILGLAACGQKNEVDISQAGDTPAESTAPQAYDLSRQYAKFAEVKMDPDTSFLSDSERQVVNKLIEASKMLDDIYLRQRNADNPAIRDAIAAGDHPDKALLLKMFDLHFGVCDGLEDNHIFYGDAPCPDGGGFYPADMTKEEFEAWIAAHPEDEEAFRSGYTVIKRKRDGLVAVPYQLEYREWIRPVAALLNEAAAMTENTSMRRFLKLRSGALRRNDYYQSELAWMDLNGNIEVAFGPYEVYDDKLFAYKTAFESFVTIKDPEESKKLAKYKKYLKDMEANLPVEESYKNFSRGGDSPIVVADQVFGGGDNRDGVQTIAFNLPNDERVREAKGAKKVILKNVLGAKYDRILAPIGERVLIDAQARLTAKKHMANSTLFHELSHSLGPGTITVNGRATTVSAELKEHYTGLEEGKADVMGAYNVLFMTDKGELPASEREAFLATYFTGLFRSMRFGLEAAHAKGAAFQYNYYRETGAAKWLPDQERYELDFEKLEQAISDLTGMVVRVQGDGNYEAAAKFLKDRVKLDAAAHTVLGNLTDIPYDIRPIYPEKI